MNVTCRFNLSSVVVERENTVTLMVRIDAPPAPQLAVRRPLNLALVLDRSGSMAGDKLACLKSAATHLAQHLKVTDRLAIVIYDDQVEVLRPSQPVGDKRRIASLLAGIDSGDTTNLSGGWLAGLNEVQSGFDAGAINRVRLLTDGLANRGITDRGQLKALGAQHRAQGITTTALGFGDDFDEDLLKELACASGGAFYLIDSPDAAPGVFTEELGELLSVVGQNLTIELRGRSPARILAVLNEYPTEGLADGLRIRVGDLFGDEQREILAEVLVPGLLELGPRQVGAITVELDQVVAPMGHHCLELPVNINVVPADQAQATPDAEVEASAALLRVNELRRMLIDLGRSSRFDEAQCRLDEARAAAESKGQFTEDLRREFDRMQDELRTARDRQAEGLKRMTYQHYAVSTGKGEYRKSGFGLASADLKRAGWLGVVQYRAASSELDDLGMELRHILPGIMEKCRVRLIIDTGYSSLFRKMTAKEPLPSVLSAEDEARLLYVVRDVVQPNLVRLVIGPWTFADRRSSHWHGDLQLALAAAGDFVQTAGLPLAAFAAYQVLLHGLRAAYPAFNPAQWSHDSPDCCLFQVSTDQRDIRRQVVESGLCSECAARLPQLGVSTDDLLGCVLHIRALAKGGPAV